MARAGHGNGPRAVLLPRPAVRAFGYFLKASLIFAPAILVSPFTWSPRPSAFSRGLPVARPAVFLAPPFMASILCAIFLKILTGDTFRMVHSAGTQALRSSGPGRPDPGSCPAAARHPRSPAGC